GRAVQVTRDLENFWTQHYPALRRQLSRRYPRHAWPEDDATAKPPPPPPPPPEEKLGGETYTDGSHAAALAALLARPPRARSEAREAGRAPRQPAGARCRGPPAAAQLRREPLPLSREQPFPLPVRTAAAGRGGDLRWGGVHALPARRRARPGAVGGRAAQPR